MHAETDGHEANMHFNRLSERTQQWLCNTYVYQPH